MQKQQYLQGFLQKNMQKHRFLRGFLQHAYKTVIFTMFSATSVKKHKYLRGFCATHMQKQGLPYLWSGVVAEMSKSRTLVTSG